MKFLHGAYSMHRENSVPSVWPEPAESSLSRSLNWPSDPNRFHLHPPTQQLGYGGSVVVPLAFCVEEALTTCRQFVDARFC